MKLCMMTYTMARQGTFGPEDFIQTAIDCEITGIDWIGTYGRDPRELQKMSAGAGLEVAAFTFGLPAWVRGDADWIDEVKQGIETAKQLQTSIVMIPIGRNSSQIDRGEYLKKWVAAMQQIAELTDDAGLTFTLENLPSKGSVMITADDYFYAKSQVPQVKMTFDNGNCAAGQEPVEALKACIDDVVHVHFKDWIIRDEEFPGAHQFDNGKWFKSEVIGRGDIDNAGCWNVLRDHGYEGYINLEYESNDVPADQAIKEICAYLRGL